MNKIVIGVISVIALVGTFFIGLSIGKSDSSETKKTSSETTTTKKMSEEDSMSTESTMKESMSMSEEALELDPSLPTPTVEIEIKKDAMKGYNLYVTTTNFEFKPESVNMAEGKTPQNEGHAHIYVNGTKLSRLYGSSYYLSEDAVKAGDKVTVSLNTNKHRSIVTSNEAVV